MIASRVKPEKELHAARDRFGYEPTDQETSTGLFWRHRKTAKHIQVPKSVQGFYPDWLLWDLQEMIGERLTDP